MPLYHVVGKRPGFTPREELFASLFQDEEVVWANTALHVDLFRDFKPDAVVDSFGPFGCLDAPGVTNEAPRSLRTARRSSAPPGESVTTIYDRDGFPAVIQGQLTGHWRKID